LSTNAYAIVYITPVLFTSAYTFANTFAAGCAHVLMYAQFVHKRWGMREGGFSWALVAGVGDCFFQGTCCWRGGLFLTEGKIEVLSVSSLFFDGGESICGCMRVYTHTHMHTLHVG